MNHKNLAHLLKCAQAANHAEQAARAAGALSLVAMCQTAKHAALAAANEMLGEVACHALREEIRQC
jgi:hypothetical protein